MCLFFLFRNNWIYLSKMRNIKKKKKKKNLFLMCTRTSNRQKLSNTGYIKGEASRLLRTKSSKATFKENITLFKQKLRNRGYLDNHIDKTLSEVNLRERMSALQNKLKTRKNILTFVMEYRSSVPNLKQFRWVNTGAIIRDGDRNTLICVGILPYMWHGKQLRKNSLKVKKSLRVWVHVRRV